MIRSLLLFGIFLGFSTGIASSQSFVRTSDLFKRPDGNMNIGRLNIRQDQGIDSLISRYILANNILKEKFNYYGMQGVRIQIYRSNNRNAKDESGKIGVEFSNKFPGIVLHLLFAEPGYYIIQVGDFRSKKEATKLFLSISKEFPGAYLVPNCYINFPDQNKY